MRRRWLIRVGPQALRASGSRSDSPGRRPGRRTPDWRMRDRRRLGRAQL